MIECGVSFGETFVLCLVFFFLGYLLSAIKFGSSDKFIDSKTGIEMVINRGVEIINTGKCKVCGGNHVVVYGLRDYDLVEI